MDQSDIIILQQLAKNAHITASEIVPIVHLSIPSINKRIERLKQSGVIRCVSIITNSNLVGKNITAFISCVLSKATYADALIEYSKNNCDILECYTVTGEYDFILKVCVKDINTLENLLTLLKRKLGVVKSHTIIALTEHKFSSAVLPCDIVDKDVKETE